MPLVVSGDTRQDREDYSYVIYTKFNPVTKQIYIGRSAGAGTPEQVAKRRDYQHTDLNKAGFGKAIVHSALVNVGGAIGYPAMRGREQQVIDSYGGVGDPLVANKIRGGSQKKAHNR